MFSALCAAAMVTSVSAQGGKDMLSNGIKYLDVPYVAHTLEADGPEELVINCDEVDCTTLVEYVLAETLTPQLADGDISESAFADNLQKIRYRDGKIDGYTSRLHYIADWINNGVRNGFLQDVTGAMSPDTERLSISYMSSHPQLYKQLANSPENIAKSPEDQFKFRITIYSNGSSSIDVDMQNRESISFSGDLILPE